MKKFLLLLFMCAGACLWAQTNASSGPNPPAQPTLVNSDSADFDLKIRRAIYHGHVLVVDPKLRLSCELLVLDLPQQGAGRLNHVLAETNVIIDFTDDKGVKYHVTSDKAVYQYNVVNSVTNETITFTGHPRADMAEGIITAEPMIWDRGTGHFYGTDVRMISHQNLNAPGSGTNASPLKLF
jgi:lipopolysaccharide export system protein LptA